MDLIANFSDPKRSKPSSSASSKTVRFSAMSEMVMYKGCDSSTDLFYTEQEYQDMRGSLQQSTREARQVLRLLRSHDTHLQAQLDFDFTGIESYASPVLMRKLMTSRRDCVRAVMEVQARGGDSSYGYDPYRLALASQRHTAWVVERAHKIGVHLHKSLREE